MVVRTAMSIRKVTVEYLKWADEKLVCETLDIDRLKGLLEYKVENGSDVEIVHRYRSYKEIEDLINSIDADMLSGTECKMPEDEYVRCDRFVQYRIHIVYMRAVEVTLTGEFDKNGLPSGWSRFISDVRSYMEKYSYGGLFDEKVCEYIK